MKIIIRICLSSRLTSTRLLGRLFKLPITGATPDGGGANTGVQVNHGVAEGSSGVVLTPLSNAMFFIPVFGSPDTIKIGSRASFLNPSSVVKTTRNAYLPSTLRGTGAFQAFVPPNPSSSDFWEKAKEYEKLLQDYVPRLLRGAAAYFKSTKFTDISSNMRHIVNVTAAFRDNIKGALDAHEITFDKLTEELEDIFTVIVDDLEKIPPPDKAPGHVERAEMVDKVLDSTTLALINLAARYGIEEEVVTSYLLALKPYVQALTMAVGDINEQHPDLLPALAFSVTALLIPQSWILRPFLSVFGFGPAGPVKGSAAAWLQHRFWGAAVKAGSWFSLLQKAGTGVYPQWAGLVAKVPPLVGALLARFPPLRRR